MAMLVICMFTHPDTRAHCVPICVGCDRTRAENKCTCAGGTGATGTACPAHNTVKCVSCTDKGQYVDTNNECVSCPAGSTCDGVTATGASV